MGKTLHLVMLLALILLGGSSLRAQTTVTQTSFTATSGNVGGDKNVSYKAEKGKANTAPAINNGVIRVYQNGGLFTVSVADGNTLTNVTLGSAMKTTVTYVTDKTTTASATKSIAANGTLSTDFTGGEKSVTYTCTGTTKNDRLYVNSLSVTYKSESTGKTATTLAFADPADRTFALNATEGTNFTNVATLTPAVEDAIITYSSDNDNLAIVDDNGEVFVTTDKVGTATINAKYEGDATHEGSTASYKINVVDASKATWSYTFESGALKDNTTSYTLNEKKWTFTPTWKSSAYCGNLDNSKGLQLGSGKNPATKLEFSSSDFAGVIQSVKVNASTASDGNATIAVTVGGVSYGEAKSLTSSSADYTFTGSASGNVVITISQPSTSKAIYVKRFDIEYNPTAKTKTNTQVKFANGDYTIKQDANATELATYTNVATVTDAEGNAISGATVTYSSSDSDHADVGSDNNGNVVIDQTVPGKYTITASYAGDDTYAASSATYTITVEETLNLTGAGTEENPYTVGDALTIINKDRIADLGTGVYVKGTVANVTSKNINSTYGSLNYTITDADATTNSIAVYGGLYVDSTKFTDMSQVAAGDIVLVKGDLLNYNNKTPEINKNNYIVKFYDRSATLDEAATTENVKAGHGITTVTLKRTFNNNAWNTLVLPFDVTAEQVAAEFGANAKVAAYSGATQNADNSYTLNFTEANSITANTPVFIYGAEAKADGYTFTGVEVKDATPTQTSDAFNFVGTYVKTTVPVGNFFINANNKFFKAGDAQTNISGTRASFEPVGDATSAKALGFSISEGGETTAINSVAIEDASSKSSAIYNLAGQRVNKAYKGVVVKEGKKYIQK